jgi:TusA-related sulfurtransferase
MKRKRGVIDYSYEDLPRGGSVVITTSDPEARAAIAEFLEAQRTDHRSH